MNSSEFERSWRPNRSQQVNYWGTPETYASNELCKRSVASKLWPQQADGLFYQGDAEIGENLHFFIKRSAPENFQREIFSKGVPTESLRTHGSEYVYERGQRHIFGRVIPTRSRERAAKRDLPAKIRRRKKKLAGHQKIFYAKSSWEKF